MQTSRTPAPPSLPSSSSTSTPCAPVLLTPPNTPPPKTSSRSSRPYDQDEMVRRELAFLPEKRTPKRRRLFGDKDEGEAAALAPCKRPKTQGKEKKHKEKSIASRPSNNAAQPSPPAQRKRNGVTTEPAGKRAVGSRPPSTEQAEGAAALRGLQDALQEAGLDDRAIAERTQQGSELEYDRPLITELMGRRERFIVEWHASRSRSRLAGG